MYIYEIRIEKFRHIENVTLGPLKFNSNISELIVFAGPNGGGKSSILELIGYALSNSYGRSWSLSRSFAGFSFEVAIGLNNNEITEVLKVLQQELETIKETMNSEITKANSRPDLNDAQKQGNIQHFVFQFKSAIDDLENSINYLTKNNVYYRAFQFSGGEYEKNSNLYNLIHSRTTATLTAALKRPLGFFLKADRSYPQKGFQRDKIFSYSNILKYEHLNNIAFNY